MKAGKQEGENLRRRACLRAFMPSRFRAFMPRFQMGVMREAD